MDEHELDTCWERFRLGDADARDHLIGVYEPLARAIAQRNADGLPADQAFRLASEALVDALHRFDRTDRSGFPTYAAARVRGALRTAR